MRIRTVFASTVTAILLAVGMTGSPVLAVSVDVAFVNGAPGTALDVCFGRREVRSNLRYGSSFTRRPAEGTLRLRVRAAAPGRCTGPLVVKRDIPLGPGADVTLVVSAKSPSRLLVFDDAGAGVLVPSVVGSYTVLRHAADLGPATFWFGVAGSVTPAVDPVFVKGDEGADYIIGDDLLATVAVTRVGATSPIASAASRLTPGGQALRVEWILVGTKPKNARLVTIEREVEDV